MPPRFVYWTIIFGGQPTAFRSATREELLPTFNRIQAKHPDAELRYFARGKLWYSDEEARAALLRERFEKKSRRGAPDRRARDWRPGGEHKDPRDRFKVPRDVKRARFKSKFGRDRFKQESHPRFRQEPHARGPRPPRPGGPPGPRPFRKPFKKPFKKKDEE
jgi:hypothetical protein